MLYYGSSLPSDNPDPGLFGIPEVAFPSTEISKIRPVPAS